MFLAISVAVSILGVNAMFVDATAPTASADQRALFRISMILVGVCLCVFGFALYSTSVWFYPFFEEIWKKLKSLRDRVDWTKHTGPF